MCSSSVSGYLCHFYKMNITMWLKNCLLYVYQDIQDSWHDQLTALFGQDLFVTPFLKLKSAYKHYWYRINYHWQSDSLQCRIKSMTCWFHSGCGDNHALFRQDMCSVSSWPFVYYFIFLFKFNTLHEFIWLLMNLVLNISAEIFVFVFIYAYQTSNDVILY